MVSLLFLTAAKCPLAAAVYGITYCSIFLYLAYRDFAEQHIFLCRTIYNNAARAIGDSVECSELQRLCDSNVPFIHEYSHLSKQIRNRCSYGFSLCFPIRTILT